jgi:hypothetical protein
VSNRQNQIGRKGRPQKRLSIDFLSKLTLKGVLKFGDMLFLGNIGSHNDIEKCFFIGSKVL